MTGQFPRLPATIARLALGALCAMACDKAPQAPVDPATTATIQVIEARQSAGQTGRATARVFAADGTGLEGLPVHWKLQAEAGTLNDTLTYSAVNGYTDVTWTAVTTIGSWTVTAALENSKNATRAISSGPGFAARVVAPDTVRFTRTAQLAFPIVAYDAYGNKTTTNVACYLSMNGGFTGQMINDVLTLSPPLKARATGEALIWAQGSTAPIGRTVMVSEIVLKSVAFAGLDTVYGLGVGQSASLSITARDSNGVAVAVDPSIPLLASSASTVVSISAGATAITVTGLKPGSANVTVALQGFSFTTPVPVVASYDLGALTKVAFIPGQGLYDSYYFFQQRSGRIFVNSRYLHPLAGVDRSTLDLDDVDGSVLWTKSSTTAGISNVVTGGDDVAYVLGGGYLKAYDVAGVERWSVPWSGAPIAASSSALYASAGVGNITALAAANGSILWTHSAGAVISDFRITPARIYFAAGSAIHALDLSGVELWSTPSSGFSGLNTKSAAVDETSALYLRGPTANTVTALDAAGATRWTISVDSVVAMTATASALIIARSHSVESRDRSTGAMQWRVATPPGTDVFANGGKVILGGAYLWVYDASTGTLLGRTTTPLHQAAAFICTPLGLQFADSYGSTTLHRYARCN